MKILNKIIACCVLCIVLIQSTNAQQSKIDKANLYFDNFAYIDAKELYLKLVKKGHRSEEVFRKLADCYYYNAELKDAVDWYEELYTSYPETTSPEYLFRYSQCLKNIEDYQTSDLVMDDFYKRVGGNEERGKLYNQYRDYLDLKTKNLDHFNLFNLSVINTDGIDFAPSFYNDTTLVYSSFRGMAASKVVHEWNDDNFLDLYSVDISNAQNFDFTSKPKRFSKNINTKLHESSSVFTKDRSTVYFTRNNYNKGTIHKDSEGTTRLKLYKADLDSSGNWTNVRELPFNSDNYSVAHPALSNDGKQLFFASDMPGTYGFSDLYVVDILDNDSYSTPRNLGPSINTESRETFPFISKSGKLYFSSDGHVGLGGLDVFLVNSIADISSEQTVKPYNLGAPINGSFDDFSFIVDEDRKLGFFSSNRSMGKGADDIYGFRQLKEFDFSCYTFLEGVITDAKTSETIPGAQLVITTTKEDAKVKEREEESDFNGKYTSKIYCDTPYEIVVSKEGYQSKKVYLKTFNEEGKLHIKDVALMPVPKPVVVERVAPPAPIINNVAVQLGDNLAEVLNLNPIYFDKDKSFIRPDAEIELRKVIEVMEKYPSLSIDIRSHTDSRASTKYNLALSSRRAARTRMYLIEHGGISPYRLTKRGYGEEQLLNECSDGIECFEEQHQLNRRSEFIIVKQ